MTIQAAAKARDRVPIDHHKRLAKSFEYFLPKIYTWVATQKNRTQQCDVEGARAQEPGLDPSAAVQEHQIPENRDTCDAFMQETQEVPLAKHVTQIDRDKGEAEKDGAEGVNEAKGEHEAEVKAEENVTTQVNESNTPQEQAVNIDVYDPEKWSGHHEPLPRTSGIILRITNQAVVNVLYDMSPSLIRTAVCGAIKKKLTQTRNFLGTSYLSDVSLSESGDICAVTHNEKKEDMFLLSQMSNWDMDIIDHDIGINFGTHWRYRIHMQGFKKESSLSGHLGPGKPKAALISELVRINTTTLTSLRIHHLRDVKYRRGTDAEEVLAVDFFDIEQARASLSRGLYSKGVRYECQTPEKHRFLARCNHCQAVGHPTFKTHCGSLRCGRYSAGHQTWICDSSLPESRPLCGGPYARYSGTVC